MWKVRFLGVNNNEFEFLMALDESLFSSETHGNSDFIECFLHIEDYDNEEATKILELAEKELEVYIAILKINGYQGKLTVDYPAKIHEDGTRAIYMFLEDTVSVSGNIEASINGVLLDSPDHRYINRNKEILKNAQSNDIKKELLILLGYEHNWINAYKIYEILKKHFKQEAELKNIDELRYFAHSANSPDAIGISNARHAVQTHQNPKRIATLNAAYIRLTEVSLEFIKHDV